jgi:hypothetical protein
MGEAARLFAGDRPARSSEKWLSVQRAKKAFDYATRQRKSVSGWSLSPPEFSPGHRQLQRVKTRGRGNLPDNCGPAMSRQRAAVILPLVMPPITQFATPPLQDRVELATLTMYRGSIPVASSSATCNAGVANPERRILLKGAYDAITLNTDYCFQRSIQVALRLNPSTEVY